MKIFRTFEIENRQAAFLYLNPTALIPCVVFLVCLCALKNKQSEGLKSVLPAIALFLLFLPAYRLSATCLSIKNSRASHHNIFPTLLDLMNYPEEMREPRNSISLLKATAKDSRPRFFNPDLLEKVPFD